jgi:hypothetical protein
MIKPTSTGNLKISGAPGGQATKNGAKEKEASSNATKPTPTTSDSTNASLKPAPGASFPKPTGKPKGTATLTAAPPKKTSTTPPGTINYDVNETGRGANDSSNPSTGYSNTSNSNPYRREALTSASFTSHPITSIKPRSVKTVTTKPRLVSTPQRAPSKGLASFQGAAPTAPAKSTSFGSNAQAAIPQTVVANNATQNPQSAAGVSSTFAPGAPTAPTSPTTAAQSTAMAFQSAASTPTDTSAPKPASNRMAMGSSGSSTAPSRGVTANSSSSATSSATTPASGLRLGGSSSNVNTIPTSSANAPALSGLPAGVTEGFPAANASVAQNQSGGAVLPGSSGLPSIETVLPLSIGMKIEAKTVIAVVAVEQGPAPIVAITDKPPCKSESCPPIVWIGQALLGPDRRIWASFAQATVDGKTYSVSGQALDRVELRPGLPAQITDEAPALVSDLLRGSIGALGDVLGAQLGSKTTTVSPSGVSQSSSNVPSLTNFFLGRLSGLFSIPNDTKALVRVARVPMDSPLTILYGIPVNFGR